MEMLEIEKYVQPLRPCFVARKGRRGGGGGEGRPGPFPRSATANKTAHNSNNATANNSVIYATISC